MLRSKRLEMRYLKNVVTLNYAREKCIGCGRCVEVCPHAVFEMENKGTKKAVLLDKDACMECGACKFNCPVEAVDVRPGVGCAYAIVMGKLRGTEPTCGCESSGDCC